MKIFKDDRKKFRTMIISLEILFFAPIAVSFFFFGGCAHTVDYQIVHDTDIVTHHDTIAGPAFIRFVALLNNKTASKIIHLTLNDPSNPELFTDVNPDMRKLFI